MKSAIVLDENLGTGLLVNTTSCITTGILNREKDCTLAELTIVGIGVIGDDDAVTKFAGDLPLLR